MIINKLYCQDNLEFMRGLLDKAIDLIYIDPPFNTRTTKNLCNYSFKDCWESVESYINWLSPRIRECHRLLKETGVFCLHLDQRSVHYAKIELDKIFGDKYFVNEVIWYYKNGGGRSRKWFNKKHDTVLIYSKSKKNTFNWKEVGEPRSQDEGTFSGYFKTDDNGRRYQEVRANGKVYKYYSDENKNSDDVWDINIISQRDKTERLGYPTQKPLALLEKIIKAFSNKGDIVADFFCGSGTTLVAAKRLDRRWIGCDISQDAIDVASKRMEREHCQISL